MLKQMLKTAKPGFAGKLLAHVMPWHPNKTSGMTAYTSNNPLTIGKQLNLMQAVGVDGVVMTWQGVGVPFQHSTVMEFSQQTSERGMLFALLFDPQCVAVRLSAVTIEQALAAQINHPDTQKMLAAPSYIPEKAFFDFDTGANFLTMAKLFPKNPFWLRHAQYSWPEKEIKNQDGSISPLTPQQVTTLLRIDNLLPTMTAPGLYGRFFNGGLLDKLGVPDFSKASFPPNPGQPPVPARYVGDQAGNSFHDCLATIPDHVPYICLVTWNDYNEGTAFEPWLSMFTGIRIN